MSKSVFGEIAIPVGSQFLSEFDRVPYGCKKVSVDVPHNKITGPVADLPAFYNALKDADKRNPDKLLKTVFEQGIASIAGSFVHLQIR